jgi:SAM-dependent methyltransferase
MKRYDRRFFDDITGDSRRSAREVLPVLFEHYRPASVVDVGCGRGAWLTVFKELGVDDFLGVDGPYVDPGDLEIEAERFHVADLAEPLRLERSFELVVCLEVAEHLPPASAMTLVESLVRMGPVVLFSAAIPHQGGVHHTNEQWPAYWASLFDRFDFVALDCLRTRIWNNKVVDWWYRQNILLFVDDTELHRIRSAATGGPRLHGTAPLPLVHPELYLAYLNAPTPLGRLAAKAGRGVRRLLGLSKSAGRP